jgi:hypothetical protein
MKWVKYQNKKQAMQQNNTTMTEGSQTSFLVVFFINRKVEKLTSLWHCQYTESILNMHNFICLKM